MLLGEELDTQVHDYLQVLRKMGLQLTLQRPLFVIQWPERDILCKIMPVSSLEIVVESLIAQRCLLNDHLIY